ncbi:MAG TPA: multicopper oxidase domain-containing protein [Rubrobacteraceae bacterium]|nr:multicopper oxidase domain-containing protein [Rubrobacteraceae bacterium]
MLKLGLLGSAALMLPVERQARTDLSIKNRIPESQLPRPFQVPFAVPPVARPVKRTATTDVYQMSMRAVQAQILPGFPKTTVFGYDGLVPGPTILALAGRPVLIRHINRLPALSPFNTPTTTSVHLHGSPSLPQYDGYASDVTAPGQYKDYRYPNVLNSACTFWYHDHAVHHTAENAYMGLAAQYHLHSDAELALPIPHGRYDVPLTIKDAIFTTNGSLVFDDNDHSSLFGDVILVNGRPWPVMKVERRKYRFRVLNASLSRSYRLALDSGEPFTIIGTDDGLMPAPQRVQTFRLAMAERYEVVIDFARHKIEDRIILRNLSNPNNEDYPSTGRVMMFEVASNATDTKNNTVPAVLNPDNATMNLNETQAVRTRRMAFERDGGQWTINGSTWDDVIKSGFEFVIANPGLGDVEIWEVSNDSGGWFHPVHIHLIDFRVLDRNGKPPFPYEIGPKDTVYVGEDEKVRLIMKFRPNRGRYMMHCHNLVHEDHDMMTQFEVGQGGNDPFSAPARDLPAPSL